MDQTSEPSSEREARREHRRRRFRRHGKRALIRSVYLLPSMATLGNAICGFAAMYVAGLDPQHLGTSDELTRWFAVHRFTMAAYLVFLAMLFDALDGRLARFTRHTTDFGGQLDSLADAISFGVAPAFMALLLFRQTMAENHVFIPVFVSRAVWAIGAIYMSCAAVRLARFNVSNEHGEQHHFSFLGLPSPGAAGTVVAFILLQQTLDGRPLHEADLVCAWLLPLVVLVSGLLMVSTFRYPHLVNKYLRGKRSLKQTMFMLALVLAVVVAHQYAVAVGTLAYTLWGPVAWAYLKIRPKPQIPATPG